MADFDNRNEYESIQNQAPMRPKKTRNGFATAALLSGILALLNLCCFSFTTAIIFGVGAISFAMISKRDQRLSTSAKIAVFLGSFGIVFGVAEYFFALNMYEVIKAPENIAHVNRMIEEAEKLLPTL